MLRKINLIPELILQRLVNAILVNTSTIQKSRIHSTFTFMTKEINFMQLVVTLLQISSHWFNMGCNF